MWAEDRHIAGKRDWDGLCRTAAAVSCRGRVSCGGCFLCVWRYPPKASRTGNRCTRMFGAKRSKERGGAESGTKRKNPCREAGMGIWREEEKSSKSWGEEGRNVRVSGCRVAGKSGHRNACCPGVGVSCCRGIRKTGHRTQERGVSGYPDAETHVICKLVCYVVGMPEYPDAEMPVVRV